MSENWPLDEQHFWPGKSYDYNGYVDVIAAGKHLQGDEKRPNMLNPQYINELERINQVLISPLKKNCTHILNKYILVYYNKFDRSDKSKSSNL